MAQQFQVEVPKVATQIKNHQDESQSVTIHLTKEEAEILEQAKRLLSNKTKTPSLKDALIYLANKEIEKSKNKMIHAEANCNYQDPKTGTKCTANHFLEQDHIQPRWAGGSDDKSNLQVLCSNHNKQTKDKPTRKVGLSPDYEGGRPSSTRRATSVIHRVPTI